MHPSCLADDLEHNEAKTGSCGLTCHAPRLWVLGGSEQAVFLHARQNPRFLVPAQTTQYSSTIGPNTYFNNKAALTALTDGTGEFFEPPASSRVRPPEWLRTTHIFSLGRGLLDAAHTILFRSTRAFMACTQDSMGADFSFAKCSLDDSRSTRHMRGS